jgi:hypothetical protein
MKPALVFDSAFTAPAHATMSDLVLRPRSATELIDAAFQVYRRSPVPFMVAMALVYVPWLAIRLLFSINVPETPDQLTPSVIRSLLVVIAGGIVLYGLAGGVVSVIARAVYLDEPIDIGGAFKQTLAQIVPLIISTIVQFTLIAIAFVFLFVPGIYLIGQFFAVRQAVVLEGAGPFSALSRSGRLSDGQKLHILGTLILITILTTVVNLGAAMLFNMQPSKVVTGVLATIVTIIVYPILGIAETVLYYDTRIRNEGFDVEYLAGAITETAPTTGPTA